MEQPDPGEAGNGVTEAKFPGGSAGREGQVEHEWPEIPGEPGTAACGTEYRRGGRCSDTVNLEACRRRPSRTQAGADQHRRARKRPELQESSV